MPRRIDTQGVIYAVRLDEQAGDPAQPAAGYRIIYAKNDGIYEEDDAGVVVGPFGAGSGGVATDPIWDAAGDLAQGTGANTASKLSIGTAYQVLRVNSGATAAEWVSDGRYLVSEQSPTATTTVTWSTIPSVFRSLQIELMGRTDEAATSSTINVYLNNDSTAGNYRNSETIFRGTTLSTSEADSAVAAKIAGNNATANSCGAVLITILGYTGTTYNKIVIGRSGVRLANTGNQTYTYLYTVEWENTAAITRVDLVASGNYLAGTKARLYCAF